MKKKSNDEYKIELSIKNPNVEVIDDYIGANTKILHHCLTHNIYWKTTPSRVLNGSGCMICKKEKDFNTRCKTNKQYIEEIKNIYPNITVLESYIDSRTPILHLCSIHNIKWKSSPDNILHNHGCPECGKEKIGKKNTKSFEQYNNEIKKVTDKIICIGEYKNSTSPVLHKCLIDGYEWYAVPSYVLSGKGCPKCGGTMKKEQNDYINEVSLINPDIEIIGDYINARTPILHKCKLDGYVWNAVPYSILSGCGCPQCNESKGEREVRQWLQYHNIKFEYQKIFDNCKDKNTLPFDFYLSDYDIAIEYDGEQHYRPINHFGGNNVFQNTLKHDMIKNNYCQKNNIKMLRIPYFKNTETELNNLFI